MSSAHTAQRLDALELAQRTRIAQARILRSVRALESADGRRRVAEMLAEPDETVGSIRLERLLYAIARFGRVRSRAVLVEAGLHRGRLSRRVLDPLDDLGLDDERAEQPVEVGDDDDLSSAGFNCLDRGSQALPLSQGGPTADVDLLMYRDELERFSLADGLDPLALLLGTQRLIPPAGLPDDSDGLPHRGVTYIPLDATSRRQIQRDRAK